MMSKNVSPAVRMYSLAQDLREKDGFLTGLQMEVFRNYCNLHIHSQDDINELNHWIDTLDNEYKEKLKKENGKR